MTFPKFYDLRTRLAEVARRADEQTPESIRATVAFVLDSLDQAEEQAQPAVPEAVAKDAAAILVQALEEIAWQRPLGVRPSKSGEAMERAAIIALHKYNALLSAADTEVKK